MENEEILEHFSLMKNKAPKCQEPPEIPLHPFSKGEKGDSFIQPEERALLPLKKGGREGFLVKPFQSAKLLRNSLILPISNIASSEQSAIIGWLKTPSRKLA